MWTVLQIAIGWFVGGVIISIILPRIWYRRVERWLIGLEAATRMSTKPVDIVEVPGVQAVLRKFRLRFLHGVTNAARD